MGQASICKKYINRTEWQNNNGLLHREDGPAIEWTSGMKEWYINGELHRVGGPAVEYPGDRREWWENDELHRIDGPAIEYANGGKEWWVNGCQVATDSIDDNQIDEFVREQNKITEAAQRRIKLAQNFL